MLYLCRPGTHRYVFVLQRRDRAIYQARVFRQYVVATSSNRAYCAIQVTSEVDLFLICVKPVPIRAPFLRVSTRVV